MKKSILNLGKSLNKSEQKKITAGNYPSGIWGCVDQGNGTGVYRELEHNEIATC